MPAEAGRYTVSYSAEGMSRDELVEAFWLIQCVQDQELRRIGFEAVNTVETFSEFGFAVPEGCSAIRVDFLVGPNNSSSSMAIAAAPLTLVKQ
jgi:hypothetical protein